MIKGDESASYTFTVFTATYNRAHTLHRVYESLAQQTYHDFEWLIVDDGSTDNSSQIIRTWQKQAVFPIRYFQQGNSGKHIAFNRAVESAAGELLLVLDSDDSCVPDALEKFKYYWDSIEEQKRCEFSGVTSLCKDQNGILVGDPFPQDVLDSDSLELRYRYKVKGEKWGFQRTDILRNYPFPEDQKKTYIPEDIIWNKIARKYKTRFVNERLRIYWIEGPSLVHEQHPEKNAAGGVLQHCDVLNNDFKWFRFSPLAFALSAIHYSRFSFHAGINLHTQFASLTNYTAKTLWVVMFPVGFFVYMNDKY